MPSDHWTPARILSGRVRLANAGLLNGPGGACRRGHESPAFSALLGRP